MFILIKDAVYGNSLVVHWLGLGAFTARARVQSLLGELRSCKSCSVAKIKKIQSIMIFKFYELKTFCKVDEEKNSWKLKDRPES